MKAYLEKQSFTSSILNTKPSNRLGLFVVIPVYKEKSVLSIFKSLSEQDAPRSSVEVLFVFNASEYDSESNKLVNIQAKAELDEEIEKASSLSGDIRFYSCLFNDLPAKHAGVGLARKIGMDEGLRRFEAIHANGIIVNTDADCTVEKNYLMQIEAYFMSGNRDGCSIYFEHPFPDKDPQITDAIIQYELYLRYFINMQRLIGFPWAFQTIGSAMAVRSDVYRKQGGMNKRKAGEDFYFLQKIVELGNFGELNSTTVFASPRPSDRVPFGTGKAVNEIIENNRPYGFYHPHSFEELGNFFSLTNEFYGLKGQEIHALMGHLPTGVSRYLAHIYWHEKIEEINQYTRDLLSFRKRFYRVFNAFQLMKYVHWMRDNYYENTDIRSATEYLFERLHLDIRNESKENLLILRTYDRKNTYHGIHT